MTDLSDFKRGEIVGTRMGGDSEIKTHELFGVARSTVEKAMTAFEKEEKYPHWSKTLKESERPLDPYADF